MTKGRREPRYRFLQRLGLFLFPLPEQLQLPHGGGVYPARGEGDTGHLGDKWRGGEPQPQEVHQRPSIQGGLGGREGVLYRRAVKEPGGDGQFRERPPGGLKLGEQPV